MKQTKPLVNHNLVISRSIALEKRMEFEDQFDILVKEALIRATIVYRNPGLIGSGVDPLIQKQLIRFVEGNVISEKTTCNCLLGITEDAFRVSQDKTFYPEECLSECLNMVLARLCGELSVRGEKPKMSIPRSVVLSTKNKQNLKNSPENWRILNFVSRDGQDALVLYYNLKIDKSVDISVITKDPEIKLAEPGDVIYF
jgi:hypothetical protein